MDVCNVINGFVALSPLSLFCCQPFLLFCGFLKLFLKTLCFFLHTLGVVLVFFSTFFGYIYMRPISDFLNVQQTY